MSILKNLKTRRDTKRVFLKKGTCSRTFFYILNREFGHPMENEEHAVDLLAGGILQQGYQCGMLWGATMAVGAESFRRASDLKKAIGVSIKASQHILKSFVNRAKSPDCLDITSCDWSKKSNIAKYFFSGKFWSCFKLAERWAPDAIEAATEGLSLDQNDIPKEPVSCSSLVIEKMGGSELEMAIVSGLAGGMGLSGNGCGALAAAVWMNTLTRIKNGDYKSSFSDPVGEKTLKAFWDETGCEMECRKITGKCFNSIEEHSEFIKAGGCSKLINVLAETSSIPSN